MVSAFIAGGFCDIHNIQDLRRLIKLAETLIRPGVLTIWRKISEIPDGR